MPLKVTIRANSAGDFSYDYDPKNRRVRMGDRVLFQVDPPGPFAVHVGWDTPLDKGRYRSSGSPIEATVRENARPGVYEFFVAALIDPERPGGKGVPELYTDDPDFIVEN